MLINKTYTCYSSFHYCSKRLHSLVKMTSSCWTMWSATLTKLLQPGGNRNKNLCLGLLICCNKTIFWCLHHHLWWPEYKPSSSVPAIYSVGQCCFIFSLQGLPPISGTDHSISPWILMFWALLGTLIYVVLCSWVSFPFVPTVTFEM